MHEGFRLMFSFPKYQAKILHFNSFILFIRSQLCTFIKFNELITVSPFHIFKHITLTLQLAILIIVRFWFAQPIVLRTTIEDKTNQSQLGKFYPVFIYYRKQPPHRIFR